MNALRDSLDTIAGTPAGPSRNQLDADLVRGKAALRRRRALQAAGGSAFAVAAVVAAVSFTTTGTGGAGTGAPVAAPPAATSTQAPAVKLVAYKGKQPEGFTVDKVPDGWFIQDSNLSSLVIAPKDRKPIEPFGKGPDGKPIKPSGDPYDDPNSFVGKITVFLQSRDQHELPDGKKVDVAGREGVLQDMEGDDSVTLWVPQGSKPAVLIQFWQGIGLTEAQMVELGAGVHVEKGAVQGAG